MPYIKRIEINGFKTFGLKTTLSFDRGFTVITGPNGSGKTNIMDAVLFCLGELSAKRLRAENFSALIFNGGEKSNVRKKRAKVLIQFDNSDGRLPVDTTTVTISREIDRKGESVYRINGRRVPRSHLLEVLSVAGISPYGHNIIPQGTLTRMAEISTHERRKIIEDMLGIAQYDAEKAKAEAKLKEADISIKTALGQISEVQKRVEDLERERNNLLRYNFIKKEINYLESIKISRKIRELETAIKRISQEIANLEEKNKQMAEKRETLRLKRREIENELRKLGFEERGDKQNRIVKIQIEIGSLKSRLSDLSAKIRDREANIKRLEKLKANFQRQTETLKEEIKKSEEKLKQLTATIDQLDKKIREKQVLLSSISSEINKIRSTFKEKAEKANELETQLNQLQEERVNIEGEYARIQSRINVYSQRLKELKRRRKELKASYERLQESLIELQEIAKKQAEQLKNLREILEKRRRQRALLEKEVKEAERIVEIAQEALIEFGAQKDLIQKIRSEEIALKNIEELSALGVIEGIHGRLRNLIKIKRGYEKAVEAAASGWLNSLVVEDLDVAFTCIETLKRMKLGKVKIIPLNGLSPNNKRNSKIEAPNIEGVKEKIISFVKYEKQYEPAVNFVLGDTLLALNEDSAIRASKEGFRAVTLNGDLYEAGGGVESGFHRTPIDLSSFVPSEKALKNLDRAVKTLKNHLENRENIIAEIEEEIDKNQSEIVSLSESIGKLESEVNRVRKSVAQTELNIRQVEDKIANLSNQIKKDREQIASFEIRLREINDMEKLIKEELQRVKNEVDLLKMHDAETQREKIMHEIILLKENYNNVEYEISTLKSKIENILKRSLENLTSQINDISKQISAAEKEIEETLKEREETKKRIEDLEREKEEIDKELISAKEETKKFTLQIDALDHELMKLEKEYEESIRELNELKLKMQTMKLQMNRYWEQLKMRGYEKPLDTQATFQKIEIDRQLELMEKELEGIGAVNQLAETQYREQVSRYKELSVRLNELEREKLAILKFIDEIEQKKYRVFMDAFNKINERINTYFFRLTGGGSASLKLENPENPFAGGVDMMVQFPGKSPILVSGASSGERSVSAVAFLFALQEFSPASFYLFDEIDAHLDAFHVERLGELLSEEASKAKLQFIIITLKPEMISKADRIYGVYSQNGVSHVVSTTFKRAA